MREKNYEQSNLQPLVLDKTQHGTFSPIVSITRPYQKVKIRLDKGGEGTITVIERTSRTGKRCRIAEDENYPNDCGCFLADGYLMQIKNERGRLIATIPLWAAYGRFRIVAANVVNGAGDEILVIRQPNRGTYAIHYDLHIFSLANHRVMDLGNIGEIVGGAYDSTVWRYNIYLRKAKHNHSLVLIREILKSSTMPYNGLHSSCRRVVKYDRKQRRFIPLDGE